MSGKFALVFGNTNYADPALARLTAPGKDAEDLARVLRDPDICGFDDVRVAVNALSSSAIEVIDEFFDGRKPDDLLVLYFSGHGIRDELGSLYLAFSNTVRTRLRSTALKAEYIREAMDESRSKRQVLVLDCCNSGAFPAGTKSELGGMMGMAAALQGYGRYVLTASDATQFAWEGDRVIGQTENSLFTHFLVKGLEGEADRDGDGTISVDDLYDYAFGQIARVTPNQTPTKSATKQEGEIVLRQITRIEDIRPVSLPDELVEAIADSRTYVREGAVQQLRLLLDGRNLGLARSARDALEKMCLEDDSLRVRKAATDALAPTMAAEQAAKAEQRTAAEQRITVAKAEADSAERQEAGRLRRADRVAIKQEHVEPQKREREERHAVAEAQGARAVPYWLTVAGMALGFGIIYLPASAIPYAPVLSSALEGILFGFIVGTVLYLAKAVRRKASVLWLALAWSLAWAVGSALVVASGTAADDYPVAVTGTTSLISGAIEGLALVLIMRHEGVLSGRNAIVWLPVTWAFAAFIDVVAAAEAFHLVFDPAGVSYLVPGILAAALGGAIGGFGTVWQIRRENGLALPPASATSQMAEASAAAPRWRAAGWIALAYIISTVLTIAFVPNPVASTVLCGALAGAAVGLILRMEHKLVSGVSVLWITMGWAAGLALAGLYFQNLQDNGWNGSFDVGIVLVQAVSGGIAGIVTGLVLYVERAASRRDMLQWLPLTWALAGAVDGLTLQLLILWIISPASIDLRYGFYGGATIAGAVIGIATIWLLRRSRVTPSAN